MAQQETPLPGWKRGFKRRGRDSNPRYRQYQYDGLANRWFQPLTHLSRGDVPRAHKHLVSATAPACPARHALQPPPEILAYRHDRSTQPRRSWTIVAGIRCTNAPDGVPAYAASAQVREKPPDVAWNTCLLDSMEASPLHGFSAYQRNKASASRWLAVAPDRRRWVGVFVTAQSSPLDRTQAEV